jgi:hypothetical protein
MNNHLIFFSGGKASFAVAHWVKEKYPEDNVVLYFTDTIWEDDDLYRFLHEVADKLKLPMLIQSMDITPLQLMYEKELVFNSRLGECSRILKQKVSRDFIFKGKSPKREEWYNRELLKNEDFLTDAKLYFGIGVDELHRKDAIEYNWQPYEVIFPLMEEDIDINELLEMYDIDKPRLYLLNFSHNNCAGRCIKGGQGHFVNLLEKDPQAFAELEEAEIVLNSLINEVKPLKLRIKEEEDEDIKEMLKDKKEQVKLKYWSYFYEDDKTILKNLFPGGQKYKYSFMKKQINNEMVPYQLRDLRQDYQSEIKLDLFDIGGCGCFIDFDDEGREKEINLISK